MICKYHKDGRVAYFADDSAPVEADGWFNSPDEALAAKDKDAAKKVADVKIAAAKK